MGLITALLAYALMHAFVSGEAQQTTARRVAVVARPEPSTTSVGTDFCARIEAYATFRGELQERLPAPRVTADIAEIRKTIASLARAIRAARPGPHEGDVFTPRISDDFRRRLSVAVNVNVCEAIMTDNPGPLHQAVTGDYPDGAPLASTPMAVLAILPPLPLDIEYRFTGRDLILLDTRANIVVDRLSEAVPCRTSRLLSGSTGGPASRHGK